MSLITPNNKRGAFKGGARKAEIARIYGNPLPLLFVPPQNASYLSPHRVLGLFDVATRSVWIVNRKHAMILWHRGFFGKGDLSRSEPSWYTRQVNARKAAGKYLTAEELREKRRAERKQFKLDRARALAEAAAEAEAAFEEGREAATIAIPSGATWKPQAPAADGVPEVPPPPAEDDGDEGDAEEEPLADVEHLQLTLQEAFFLLWTLDCLTVLEPTTHEPLDLRAIWAAFQRAHHPPGVPASLSSVYERRFDNPFLVHYAAYHYYRSLGWVVKGGVKFCVDYLLYKRGPVFQHAEFAIVVMPVYEDSADQADSPFELNNAEPFSWTWLSTVNRVNSQVQKTLIMTYVTIPSRARVSPEILASPACLAHYRVREVVLRRFIPARMRD